MAFHHRKLLNESLAAAICDELICDISKNPDGWCPKTCWNICPTGVCRQLIIPPPPPPPSPPPPPIFTPSDSGGSKGPKLSLALTASLAVLATAFFLFTCYTIYKFYTVWSNTRRRRPPPQREAEDDDDDSSLDQEDYGPVVDHPIWYIRTIGLQPSVINAITIVNYKRGEGLVEGSDCAVCLSEFEEDETLRLLPKCNHAFHVPCIDTWLRSHTNCPMCRAGIVLPGPLPADSHDSGQAEEEVSGSESEGEEARSQTVVEISENIELGDECKVDVGVRRSVSMDSLSASMISADVANAFGKNSDSELVKEKGTKRSSVGTNRSLLRLSSIERCMQTGSSSIKRSASCSAKLFLSRHSSSSRS